MPRAATVAPNFQKRNRRWRDYDIETNTFYDEELGVRVTPDGTPVEEAERVSGLPTPEFGEPERTVPVFEPPTPEPQYIGQGVYTSILDPGAAEKQRILKAREVIEDPILSELPPRGALGEAFVQSGFGYNPALPSGFQRGPFGSPTRQAGLTGVGREGVVPVVEPPQQVGALLPDIPGAIGEKAGPALRRLATEERGGVGRFPPSERPGLEPGLARLQDPEKLREYAESRIAELEKVLDDAREARVYVPEERLREIQEQELPYLKSILQEPSLAYPDLSVRARETGTPREATTGERAVAERGLQSGFDESLQPTQTPFEQEIKPEYKPVKPIEGEQGRLGLEGDIYIPPGLTSEDEAALRAAQKRGDKKSIERLMRKGQSQLLEGRTEYSPRSEAEEVLSNTRADLEGQLARLDSDIRSGLPVDENEYLALTERLEALDKVAGDILRQTDAGRQAERETIRQARASEVPTSPFFEFLDYVAKSGKFKGQIPEAYSPLEFRRLTGTAVPQSLILTSGPNKGKIPAHYALDEAMEKLRLRGFADLTDTEFIDSVNNLYKEWQAIPQSQRPRLKAFRPRPRVEKAAKAEPPPPQPTKRLSSDEIRAARLEGIPLGPAETVRGQLQERGLSRTFRTAELTPEALVASLQLQPELYLSLPNAVSFRHGQALIASVGEEETITRILSTHLAFADAAEAQAAFILAQKLVRAGDPRGVSFARHAARRATVGGQASQIWAQLRKMSVEGIMVELQRLIDNYAAQGGKAPERLASRLQQAEQLAVREEFKQKAKTIREALDSRRAMRTGDFLDELTAFFESEAGSIGPGSKKPASDIDILMPDEVQRFFERAQEIKSMGAGPERDAAKASLLSEIKTLREERLAVFKAAPDVRTPEGKKVVSEALSAQKAAEGRVRQRRQKAQAELRKPDPEFVERSRARLEADIARREAERVALQERMSIRYDADTARRLELAEQFLTEARARLDELEALRPTGIQPALGGAPSHALEVAKTLRENNRLLTQFERGEAKALLDAADKADRLMERTVNQEMRNQLAAQSGALRQHYNDLNVLTGKLVPEAVQRARKLDREIINTARRMVSERGLALPPAIARNFLERARAVEAMEPGLQQKRLYEALMRDAKNLLPPSKWQLFFDILFFLPRALKTMWDDSFMLRQGGILGVAHPKEWLKTWSAGIKAMRSPEAANAIQDAIADHPLANAFDEAGLYFGEFAEGGFFPLTGGEEFFASQLSKYVPGMRASERAFVVNGNKLRWGSMASIVKGWLPDGFDIASVRGIGLDELATLTGKTPNDIRQTARLLNSLTGRADIKWLTSTHGWLNTILFAPRWTLSIPVAVGQTLVQGLAPGGSKTAAAIGASALAAYYGGVSLIEGLGDIFGVWDAEADPRSSNFGKVRFKGTQTWVDPTIGMGVWVRTAAQLATQSVKASSGQIYHLERGEAFSPLGKFLRNKLAPVPGELWNWVEGQDIAGKRRDVRDPGSYVNSLRSLFVPITPDNIVDAIQEDGLRGGIFHIPEFFGVSTQTYVTPTDVKNKVSQELYAKPFVELNQGQRRTVNDSLAVRAAYNEANFPEPTRREIRQDRFKRYNQVVNELESNPDPLRPGLRQYLDAGMQGTALRERIQQHKEARYRAAADLLTPDILEDPSADKKQIEDVFAEAYWNVPLREDLTTGEQDFKSQRQERQSILDQAIAAGVSEQYITGISEGTFRGKKYRDPVVRKALEAYDSDMETLRPYWELRDTLIESMPAMKEILERAKTDPLYARLPVVVRFNQALGKLRQHYRVTHRDVLEALYRWYPDSLSKKELLLMRQAG